MRYLLLVLLLVCAAACANPLLAPTAEHVYHCSDRTKEIQHYVDHGGPNDTAGQIPTILLLKSGERVYLVATVHAAMTSPMLTDRSVCHDRYLS